MSIGLALLDQISVEFTPLPPSLRATRSEVLVVPETSKKCTGGEEEEGFFAGAYLGFSASGGLTSFKRCSSLS